MRVGSFSARRDCGYSDAQALPIYNSKKIASGKGGEKIKGVCKKMKLYTAAVVAKWLDISERRVRQLRDQKVLEEARPGLYSLKDCIHRYIEYLRKDGQNWCGRRESARNWNCNWNAGKPWPPVRWKKL